jgi:HlyD family secretion protein
VQEFVEGTYEQQLQICDANITIALESLRSAENTYHYTERMARKGYVPSLQRDAQAFAVERAKLDLVSARTAKNVLEKFTRAKTLEDLESKRDTAEAKMRSEEAAFSLEEGRLKRLSGLLEKCTMSAPREGMVIYANDPGGRPGAQSVTIEEGAMVRERQSIIRLPDLDHMQVKALVNEAKVERVRAGMRARIRIQDVDYQGTVASVANQAEPASFFASAVKVFATIVKIDDEEIPHDGVRQLKPGMTASVEILIAHLKDVLSVPMVAIREQSGHNLCWVRSGGRVDRRELQLGPNDNTMIEVKSGLNEGDEVLLNPAPYAGELATEFKSDQPVDVKARYGEQSAPSAGAPGGSRGASGAGEGPGRGPGRSAGGSAPSGGPDAGGAGGGGPGGGAGGGGRGSGRGGRGNVMQYDADHDGKVSREEAPEAMSAFFDRIDENHDGFIDANEAAAAAARRRQREAEGGGGGGGGGGAGGP